MSLHRRSIGRWGGRAESASQPGTVSLVPFHAEEGDPQEGLSEARLTEEWGAGSKDRDPACCWSSQSFLSLPVRVVIL